MDKKNNRPRSEKTSGRKVMNEYDWEAFDRRTSMKPVKRETAEPSVKLVSEAERKKRYKQQQKQQKLKIQRIRALMIFASAVIFMVILLFMTPLFNIREIAVSGNQVVTAEEMDAQIGNLVGENLFKTSGNTIVKRLKNIAYIEDVSVSKRLFPPSVKVVIKECRPAGYVGINGFNVVLNSELKVISDSNNIDVDNIPQISGVNTDSYKKGETFKTDSDEKTDALKTFLSSMERLEMIQDINYLDISSITDIEFRYQDRINVECGSSNSLERKLNLFKETVKSNNIAPDARGTLDLSIAGRATLVQ